MSQRERGIDIFVRNLTEAKFEEIFDNKEDLDKFYTFLRNRAVPAGGYVVSFPVTEGGLFWLLYKIRTVRERRDKLHLELDDFKLFYPKDFVDRTIPTECKGYPVWWLEERYTKQNA